MSGSIAGTNTLAIDAAPPTLMGAVMGGMNTMQPLGILFFLALGGILFDAVSPSAAFAVKGIATLILAVWLFMIRDAVTKEIKPTFAMEWEDDARRQMMKIPGTLRQGIIEATESCAAGQGMSTVTCALCIELRKQLEKQQPA